MHKFCLRLIVAYKWSIVVLEKSLSPQGHPSGIWTQESLSLNRPPPRALHNLLGSGLVSFIKLRAREHSGRLLCKTSLPKARLFIATCSSLRNSRRNSSWLLSPYPAAARPLTEPGTHTPSQHRGTHTPSQHRMRCKTIHWESAKETPEVERRQKQVGRVEGKDFPADCFLSVSQSWCNL